MSHSITMKSRAAQVALRIWAALLLLFTLPLAFLALVSLEKLRPPVHLNHMTLEVLLVIATAAGLFSPFALASQSRSMQFLVLAVSTVAVGIGTAALFSPLYQGFIH